MKFNLLLLVVLLSGCAASIVDTGVTLSTGKSIASHALSKTHNQDCNTLNLVHGNEICNKLYYGQTYQQKLSKDLLSQY
jgi:uncharacterized protein YceK